MLGEFKEKQGESKTKELYQERAALLRIKNKPTPTKIEISLLNSSIRKYSKEATDTENKKTI